MTEHVMSIPNLGRPCTYPLPEGGQSDAIYNCGKGANTAVKPKEGGLLYRCPLHKGLVDSDTIGPICETVPMPNFWDFTDKEE